MLYVAGEHLATGRDRLNTECGLLGMHLPIPPIQQLINLVLLLWVIQELQYSLIE
jgi:hypothetical protein